MEGTTRRRGQARAGSLASPVMMVAVEEEELATRAASGLATREACRCARRGTLKAARRQPQLQAQGLGAKLVVLMTEAVWRTPGECQHCYC